MTDTFTIGEFAYDMVHRRMVTIAGPLELHTGIEPFHAYRCEATNTRSRNGTDSGRYACYCRPINLRKLEQPQRAKWKDVEMITRGWNPTRTVGL